MYYTHSNNNIYRANIGYVPKSWLSSTAKDPMEVMHNYYREHLYVYDADNGGDEEVIFVFENGQFFRLTHEYWITYDPEWEIHNCYYIDVASADKVPDWMKTRRDWI